MAFGRFDANQVQDFGANVDHMYIPPDGTNIMQQSRIELRERAM